jgi:hypothetical protein
LPNHDAMEQELNLAGSQGSSIPLPDNIDAYLLQGIARGKVARRKVSKRNHRRVWSVATACLLLVTCLFTIRISPVFASILRDIPGLKTFVNLIHNQSDRGIQLALDNEFVQPIGVSDEYGGIKFTVEGIIADETRVIIFYAIESSSSGQRFLIDRPQITDSNGKDLQAGIGWSNMGDSDGEQSEDVQRGTLDVQMAEGVSLPTTMVLKVELPRSGQDQSGPPMTNVTDIDVSHADGADVDKGINHLYSVAIPIDHEKFAGMKQEYVLNQTITVDGQRITFIKATLYPLRMAVEVQFDEKNSKQVFGPGDIHMTDEKGEVWRNFSGSGDNKNHSTIDFESNYFHNPKELYLEGEWFRALDKDKMDIIIDTKQNKLIQAPDSRLKIKNIISQGDYLKLSLFLQVDDKRDTMTYNVFDDKFKDASGKEYDMASIGRGVMGSYMGADGEPVDQESYQYLDDQDYKQPLTFHIFNYPNYIRQPYKIRIK